MATNQTATVLRADGAAVEVARLTKLLRVRGGGWIGVGEDFVGDVVIALAKRRAELIELRPSGRAKVRAVDYALWNVEARGRPSTAA